MKMMDKPSQQRHVKPILCLHADIHFARIPGSVLGFPASIQPWIRSSRNTHRPFPDEFPGGLEM